MLQLNVIMHHQSCTHGHTMSAHPLASPQIALTVFYEGAEGLKSTTFFNQTVEIVEVKKLIDTDLIMLYILLISLMAVGGEAMAAARGWGTSWPFCAQAVWGGLHD